MAQTNSLCYKRAACVSPKRITGAQYRSERFATLYKICYAVCILPVFRRVEDVETAVDLRAIPGLHMLIGPNENIILLAFLRNVHLLSVWQIAITAVAVAILAEVNKAKACLTAVIIWLLRVGIDVIFQISSAS